MENKYYLRTANYYETDKMGIVHHSNHIRYFEEARIDFMHKIGCDVKELEEQGVIIPNVDAYAKYLKPIRFSDEIYVTVRLSYFNGVKMEYDYEIKAVGTNELLSEGHTTHCFVNADFKPLILKRTHPEYYMKLKKYVTEAK